MSDKQKTANQKTVNFLACAFYVHFMSKTMPLRLRGEQNPMKKRSHNESSASWWENLVWEFTEENRMTVWSCFERHVPTTYSGCEQKLPWMTRELTSLKNNEAKALKKSKDFENRCLKDDSIDNFECERLPKKFATLRAEYQHQQGGAYDNYRAGIEVAIKSDTKTLFLICRLKEKARWLPISYAF
jgi:hypothetical protein